MTPPTPLLRVGRLGRATLLALLVSCVPALGATVTKDALSVGIAGFPGPGAGVGVYEPGPAGAPDAFREVGQYAVTVVPDPLNPLEAPFAGTWKAFAVDDITHHTDDGVPVSMVLQLAVDAWAGEYPPEVATKLTWLLRNADGLIAQAPDPAQAAAAIQVVVWQTLRNPPLAEPRTDLVEPTNDAALNALAAAFTTQMETGAVAGPPTLQLAAGPVSNCVATVTLAGTPGAVVVLTIDNNGVLSTRTVTLGPDGTATVTAGTQPGVTVTVTGRIETGGVLVRADVPGPAVLDQHTTPSHESEAPEELIFLAGADAAVVASVPLTCPAAVVSPPPAPAPPAPAGVLRLLKSAPPTAVAGTTITFRIRVRNVAAVPVSQVVLRDVVPAGTSVAAVPHGSTLKKGAVVWDLGLLAPGEQRTLAIRLRIDRDVVGRRCNNANASAANAPTVRARACTNVRAVAGVVQVPIVTG